MLDWNNRSSWVLPDRSLIGARELGRSVLVIEIGACDCDRDACDQDGVDRSL